MPVFQLVASQRRSAVIARTRRGIYAHELKNPERRAFRRLDAKCLSAFRPYISIKAAILSSCRCRHFVVARVLAGGIFVIGKRADVIARW